MDDIPQALIDLAGEEVFTHLCSRRLGYPNCWTCEKVDKLPAELADRLRRWGHRPQGIAPLTD